jgi:hypothetical protein
MKWTTLALAILAGSIAGLSGTTVAQAVEFDVGPGGVYVGPHHHWRDHDWRDSYGYDRGCRVIVRHHWNRWGERVTTRTRVCD